MDIHHSPFSFEAAKDVSDYHDVHRMLCEARGAIPKDSIDDIKEDFDRFRMHMQGLRLRQPGLQVYRAENADQIVGMSHMTFFESSGRLSIDAIAVDETVRGRGYGRRILKIIDMTAAHLGAEELRLDVLKSNNPALELYQKAGFTVVDGDSATYHRMVKPVSS